VVKKKEWENVLIALFLEIVQTFTTKKQEEAMKITEIRLFILNSLGNQSTFYKKKSTIKGNYHTFVRRNKRELNLRCVRVTKRWSHKSLG